MVIEDYYVYCSLLYFKFGSYDLYCAVGYRHGTTGLRTANIIVKFTERCDFSSLSKIGILERIKLFAFERHEG